MVYDFYVVFFCIRHAIFFHFFDVDTGIASEKDWEINLLNGNVNESGTNEDGSTWFRESGEDLDENGFRCRWTRMGGQSRDASSEWKETVCYCKLLALLLFLFSSCDFNVSY